MSDLPRRFDDMIRSFGELRRFSEDRLSTLAAQLGSHSHPGSAGQVSGTGQTIAASTNVAVSFPTVNMASPDITRNVFGEGHSFTVNRTGRWTASTTVRFAANSTGERYLGLHFTNGNRLGADGCGAAVSPITLNVSVTRWLAQGSVIFVNAFQSSGGALDLVSGDGWMRLDLVYLGL